MTSLSTHVLDAADGVPAAGLVVTLSGESGSEVAQPTDADGRVGFGPEVGPGTYRLVFATGPWFDAAGRSTFFPEITITFTVLDGQPHYHVALLLSAYSYTTYRGS